MKKLRILALMHEDLLPPEGPGQKEDSSSAMWKTEYDVVSTLREMGHDVHPLGLRNDLRVLRETVEEWQPHIAFNLLEEFDDLAAYDQNVVSYLELLRVPYTGCNPRGLMLTRDKGWTKKILSYHRIPTPEFCVIPIGRRVKRPKHLQFPLIVKSLSEEASLGISQASIVEDDEQLQERVEFIHTNQAIKTAAIVERFIEGREFYVGILGGKRLQVLPVWELVLENMPEDAKRIATARVKWCAKYQEKYGIRSRPAKGLSEEALKKIQHLAKRVYRVLGLSGYARIDLRIDLQGKIFVLEANPNAQLAFGEDLADSAEHAGLSYEALLQRILNIGLQWEPGHVA